MKLIQVGLGEFGFGWLKDVLLKYDGIQIMAVVDRNQEALNMAKELPGMNNTGLFTDLREALTVYKPDFILNITPPAVHKDIDFTAYEYKIPVLSEKPIAETYEDAKEIFDKSLELNVPVMIAENYRYFNIVRTVQKFLISGEIGKINSIHVDFSRKHRMNNYHKSLQHPLLLDVTIHHIDIIRYLTGVECRTVFARAWTPQWSWYEGYSTLDLLLDMEKDVRVSYRGSLSSFKNDTDWMGNWVIEGESGMIKMSEGIISIIKEDGEQAVRVTEECDSRKLVLEEFINSLKKGSAGETDIRDNMKTFEIVDAASRSICNSKVVKMERNV
jgi:predicted dehydrogenase